MFASIPRGPPSPKARRTINPPLYDTQDLPMI